jgi:hypothetical protein
MKSSGAAQHVDGVAGSCAARGRGEGRGERLAVRSSVVAELSLEECSAGDGVKSAVMLTDEGGSSREIQRFGRWDVF